MAIFKVTDPSGNVVRVEAPEGTSDRVLSDAVLRRYYAQEVERNALIKPELANPEEVSAKLGTGLGALLGLTPALLAGPAAPLVAAGIGGAAGAGEASERARADGATEEQRAYASRRAL